MDAVREIRNTDWRNSLNPNHLISKTKGDKVIWALVVLLALVSLLAVYSATGSLAYKNYRGNTEIYLFKQIIFIFAGIMVIYFAHLVNYTFYSRAAKIVFLLSLPLLVYTLFFGVKMNEGSRWIRLPLINMTMQTSDLARLALFMYLARLLSKKQDVIKDFKKGYLPVIAPVAVTCALIAPANLSTALLLGASLFWGGLYDISYTDKYGVFHPSRWTTPHSEHRKGEEIDISFTRAGNPIRVAKQKQFYKKFCEDKKVKVPFSILHHYKSGPHFHIRLVDANRCGKTPN